MDRWYRDKYSDLQIDLAIIDGISTATETARNGVQLHGITLIIGGVNVVNHYQYDCDEERDKALSELSKAHEAFRKECHGGWGGRRVSSIWSRLAPETKAATPAAGEEDS